MSDLRVAVCAACFFPALAAGCTAPTATPATQPSASAAGGQPTAIAARPESSRSEPPTPARAPADASVPEPAPSLCAQLCLARSQARAVAAEMIEADCAIECRTPRSPDPACKKAVAAARRHVEAVAMLKRAPRVFAALADPAVSCGVHDPVLRELSTAGATPDLEQRDAALQAVLSSDPFITAVCAAAPAVFDELAALPERRRAGHLARGCPLEGIDPDEGPLADLGPMTLLAERTIAARWQVYGATTSDHEILLAILRLASGLERDAQR